MVGHGGSSDGSYLADPTSPIPSHCTSIVATSTVRVNFGTLICSQWERGGGEVLVRYEPALLPPCPTIRVISYTTYLSEIYQLQFWVNFQKFSTLRLLHSFTELFYRGYFAVIRTYMANTINNVCWKSRFSGTCATLFPLPIFLHPHNLVVKL